MPSIPSEPAGEQALTLRPPRHRVSPRALRYWALRAACAWLVLLAAEVAWLLIAGGDHREAPLIALVATALVALAHVLVMPRWRYRVHRWEATADAVYTQTGWLEQERRIAPLSRIQTVDSERGPFEQLLGLANVTVTTASAARPLRIEGLERATADQLVDELTAWTEAIEGDAT